MFVGLHPFTHNYFSVPNMVGATGFNKIVIKDCKMDELKIDEAILNYINSKEEWSYDTILLAKFQNSLSAGNMDNNGAKIEKLKLKKRNIENMTWMDVKIFNFDVNVQNYSYNDRLVEALETYEYAIQPMTGNVLGEEKAEQIDCDFEGSWIIGKDKQYQLYYNMSLGDIETVKKTNVYEPLGSKYPIIIENGLTNYKKTNVKALLVADSTVNNTSGEQIDRKAEKRLRQEIEKFFNEGKPFIFKDSSGNYMLGKNISSIRLVPQNELSQQLYEIDLDVCEIGDPYDIELLKMYGFIEEGEY